VLFVDSKGDLVVADAETGEMLPDFVDAEHPEHPAEIREITIKGKKEPVLFDKHTQNPIAEPRLLSQRQIYFWRYTYTGSTCECIWSNGKHIVRRRG
jgi:hypothetical protein